MFLCLLLEFCGAVRNGGALLYGAAVLGCKLLVRFVHRIEGLRIAGEDACTTKLRH